MSITSIIMTTHSVYCFYIDPLGRPPCLTDSALLATVASQVANSGDDATRQGIHEAVWQLCFVDNFDNHDFNYDFLMVEDRCSIRFAKNDCYV